MSQNQIIAEVEQYFNDEIDAQFNTLDPKKLTFKKLKVVTINCLTIIGCLDATKFMINHSLPITDENIEWFKRLADEFYKIRMEILKELVEHDVQNVRNVASG